MWTWLDNNAKVLGFLLALAAAAAGVWKFFLERRVKLDLEREATYTENFGGPLVPTKLRLTFKNPSFAGTAILNVEFTSASGQIVGGHRYRDQLDAPFQLPARSAVAKVLTVVLEDEPQVARIIVTDLDDRRYPVPWSPTGGAQRRDTAADEIRGHQSVHDELHRADGGQGVAHDRQR